MIKALENHASAKAEEKQTAKQRVLPKKPKAVLSKEKKEETALSTELFTKEEISRIVSFNKMIAKEIATAEKSFMKVAFVVTEMYRRGYYRHYGYKNIADYALTEHGISKTTCYAFLSIVERFGKAAEGTVFVKELQDAYREYTPSKLMLMTDLTDEQLAKITPDMSVRQIKQYIKHLNALPEAESNGNEEKVKTTGKEPGCPVPPPAKEIFVSSEDVSDSVSFVPDTVLFVWEEKQFNKTYGKDKMAYLSSTFDEQLKNIISLLEKGHRIEIRDCGIMSLN